MVNPGIIGKPDEIFMLLTSVGIILVGIATLVGFLGRWSWLFDLFSHFRVQYLLLLIGLLGLSLFFASKPISYLGLGFLALNLMAVIPFYIPDHRKLEGRTTTRILLSNVLRPNQEYDKLRRVIRETRPDIIVLIEISETWMRELDSELQKYAHCQVAWRGDNYGIAVVSHYALNDIQIHYFSDANVPSLIASVDIHGCPLTMITSHPPPPKTKRESEYRNQQFRNMAAFAASQTKPYMLLGDLNSTSWSPHFRELIHRTGLHDSRKGFGIQPTWPVGQPIFMVPVDHVLVSEGITIRKRFTGPAIGSDHRPVIVDFSLEPCTASAHSMV